MIFLWYNNKILKDLFVEMYVNKALVMSSLHRAVSLTQLKLIKNSAFEE